MSPFTFATVLLRFAKILYRSLKIRDLAFTVSYGPLKVRDVSLKIRHELFHVRDGSFTIRYDSLNVFPGRLKIVICPSVFLMDCLRFVG